jgi:ATP-binding cassette, subfamily B, bacterial
MSSHSQSQTGPRSALVASNLHPVCRQAAGAPGIEGELVDRERETRRAGWRLLRGALRSQRAWLGLGVLAGTSWTAAKITVPLLAAGAIDNGIIPGDSGAIVAYALVIVGVGVIQGLSSGFRRYCAFRMAYRTETDLRARLFAHLQRLHFAFHDEAQTGQLMARANTDIFQINMVVILIPLTIASALTLVGVVTVMSLQSLTLTLLALGALPLLNISAARFSRRMQPVTTELQQKLGDLTSVVEESVAGVRAVKGFGSERLQSRQLDSEADAVRSWSLETARLRAGFLPLVDFLPALALVAILWYGGHLVLNGELELGYIVAFNSYVLMLIWPLRMAGMLVAQASRASAAAGRLDAILVTEPEVVDKPGARALPPGPGEIRFEDVDFGYRGGRPIFTDLHLLLRGGEAVAVVGPTGSGKSTVARLVPRFYDVDGGRVLLDGVDVRDVKVHDLRHSVGIVFEDTFLFSDTVRDNIAFADPQAPMDDVRRAARLAGADEFIDDMPDGYETIVGEQGYTLSGGQRQRLAIARAVLADPRVLILDDATSSVDPTKEHEIRAALREVMAGRTTLIIAHRPATIALADRVVLIDEGRVMAEGTHDELLANSERYREVLAQAAAIEAAATVEPVQ